MRNKTHVSKIVCAVVNEPAQGSRTQASEDNARVFSALCVKCPGHCLTQHRFLYASKKLFLRLNELTAKSENQIFLGFSVTQLLHDVN